MSDPSDNPYAPPASADEPPLVPPSSSAELRQLRHRHVLLMLLLTVVTLGLYINYWTHRLALDVNRGRERPLVSLGLVVAFWVLSITSLLWLVPELVWEEQESITTIGTILNRVDMVFALLMAFTIRAALNAHLGLAKGEPGWFRGGWTFLFGMFYLQWKINWHLHRQ